MTEFAVFISEFVIAESSQGDSDAAARRMTVIEGIPELNISEEVKDLAKALIAEGSIPERAEVDAYHIAVATVNGMDYLLTWNCTHIANAVMRPKDAIFVDIRIHQEKSERKCVSFPARKPRKSILTGPITCKHQQAIEPIS